MSNHWHCVLTDEHGRLPEFTQWVHLFIGKCINKAFSREETLWSSDEPCYEELCDDGAVPARTAQRRRSIRLFGGRIRDSGWQGANLNPGQIHG